MDASIIKKFKNFIENNQDLLNDNEWGELYSIIYSESSKTIGAFTQLFLKAGLNPLNYILYIPNSFLAMTDITLFVVPDNILTIANAAFYNCEELEEIKLPKTLETIGSNVFAYCFNLKNIEIPDKVKRIGKGTFCECSRLESISIGKNLDYIEEQAFEDCGKLKDIYFRGNFEEFDCDIVLIGNGCFFLNTTLHCLDGDYKYNEDIHEWVKI